MEFPKILKKLVSNSSGVYKAFTKKYDLVYFGSIDHTRDEEQRIVRGATVSTQHVDNHYSIGTIHGYDVILLERFDTLSEPTVKKPESYRWIMIQVDLHSTFRHPHVFLDGRHHDALFYKHIFMKFALLRKVETGLLAFADRSFHDRFTCFTAPGDVDILSQLLTSEISATLSAHFSHLDFEWWDDTLIVYSNGKQPTGALLEHMLRSGLWLARELDEQATKLQGLVDVAPSSSPLYENRPVEPDGAQSHSDWR